MSVNLTWSSDNSTGVFVNLTEDFKGVGNRKNNGMSWIPLHNKRRALINNLSLDTSHALETCHYKHSMHFSLLRRHCMESATEFARISVFFVIGALIDSGNDSPSDVDDNIGWKCCCDVRGCELERAGFEQMQRSSLHKLWPHLDVAWLDVVHHNVVWK
jgi:hypothetical protein